MVEVLPQVFRWTAFHEGIGMEVSSLFVAGESGLLVDPMLPEEGVAAVAAVGEPRAIALTNRHHLRASERFAERFGCPILCHEAGLHEFAGGGPEVRGFRFGDGLAPGVTALEMGAITPEETALRIDAGDGALSIADAIVHYGDQLAFVPDFLLGDDPEAVKRAIRAAARRLLAEDFDTLLFAHGDPVVGGAKDALRRFVDEDGGRAAG